VTSNAESSGVQLSFTLQAERRVFSVSELTSEIGGIFSQQFRDVWVLGEISGCKAATSGHFYFSLKDATSQVKAVLFRGSARWLKFRPQDGMMVLARGSLDVYEARGEYQLIVEHLEPQGAGALQLAFEQLKKKLEAEGLFAATRKRPLPKFPQRIGIVTSPSGAVIRDILHVLSRRFPGLHIRLFPAQVQGDGAMEQVCRGLQFFSTGGWADVVIVARGGGSIEDLWTFNEEAVARAIAACGKPVISAIGHETDYTIADFVADLRAPTPSAAAELLICTRESLLEQITAARERLLRAARYRILMCARELQQHGAERAEALLHRTLTRGAQRVDELEFTLRALAHDNLAGRRKHLQKSTQRLQSLDLRLRYARAGARLNAAEFQLKQLGRGMIWKAQHRYESLTGHMKQLSPLAVLGRGYSIVQDESGRIVRRSKDTEPGKLVNVRLGEGRIEARVERSIHGPAARET
jgi:exodeoxyribonuclease VII large subunit